MCSDIETTDTDSVFLKKKTTKSESATSSESLLYPELPEDYLSDSMDTFFREAYGLKSIVERYENAKVKPYVRAFDLNNDAATPYENKPKMGYEIGLMFSF